MPRGGTRTSEPGSPTGSSAMSIERSRGSASGHSSSPQWPAMFDERYCTLFRTPFTFELSSENVTVLAVLHLRRHRHTWLGRAR